MPEQSIIEQQDEANKGLSDLPEVPRYLVLRQFESHDGTHFQGAKLPKKVATDPVWVASLYYLKASGLVAQVAEDGSYDRLPPHMFSAVQSQQELDGVIAVGESPVTFNEWVKATEVSEVEALNEAQRKSEEENARRQAERAVKQNEIALKPFVEARPVVVPHKIPAIDAMQTEAREQAEKDEAKRNPDTARSVEVENQDGHAEAQTPEKTVEPSTDRDGADVNDQVHTDAATVADTEGPDSDDAKTVVPSTEESHTEARGPVRSYDGLNLKQLQDEAEKRDLPKSGNKAELRERLVEDDQK